MPAIDDPQGVGASLPGQLKELQRVVKDLSVNRTFSPNIFTVGAGGFTDLGPMSVSGLAAFLSAVTLNGVTGPVAATGALSGSSLAVTGAGTFGTVGTTGDITTPTSLRGADIYATNAPTFNITGGRVTAWWETATGRGGFTASSRRFKTEIGPADIDPLAVLKIGAKHYRYIDELRKRDDPTFEDYVGPEYRVALEVGMIAEDLHDAGLWQFVIYERNYTPMDVLPDADPDAEPVLIEGLKLDSKGKPIPQSIHYELWSIAVHRATQYVWAEHQKLVELQKTDRADIDRILKALGI